LGRVYASATGTNEVVAIDEKSLAIIARIPGGTYPDGLAYSPETRKIYVSDEHGGTDTVIDVVANARVATVQIGGVIGNTQYDAASQHVFINAQSAGELVEVDPATDNIVRRIKVPGASGNHGLLIDADSHRAFIACEGNDRLIVLDLRSGASLSQFPVAKDPEAVVAAIAARKIQSMSEKQDARSGGFPWGKIAIFLLIVAVGLILWSAHSRNSEKRLRENSVNAAPHPSSSQNSTAAAQPSK